MNDSEDKNDFKSTPDPHENHNHPNNLHDHDRESTNQSFSNLNHNYNENNYFESNPLHNADFFEAKPVLSKILSADKIIEEFKKRQTNLENVLKLFMYIY